MEIPTSLTEALKKARYNEFVRVETEDENGSQRVVVLLPCLDEKNGGIEWKDSSSSDAGTYSLLSTMFRTKLWFFPMLNDHTRNRLYNDSIRQAVQELVRDDSNAGKGPRTWSVLDIGCGSGILGLMAARAFRDLAPREDSVSVTSIEMSHELAQVAKRTICDNRQFSDLISVVEDHSCQLPPIPPPRPKLCISELLESGLLGEGILPALRDAWERQLDDEAIMIPQGATLYAQLVGSDHNDWIENCYGPHNFNDMEVEHGGDACALPKMTLDTEGSQLLLDARMAKLPVHATTLFRNRALDRLSDGEAIFTFDFSSRDSFPARLKTALKKVEVSIHNSGVACGVLLWWDLRLYQDNVYSTRPGQQSWQDHWHQCLHPITRASLVTVHPGDTIVLNISHNEERFFVEDIQKNGDNHSSCPEKKRARKEDFTASWITPFRAFQLNDFHRTNLWKQAISHILSTHLRRKGVLILDVSDFGWGACLAASLGAEKVWSVESNPDDEVARTAARIAQVANQYPRKGCHFEVLRCHAEILSMEVFHGACVDVVMADYFQFFEGWHLQEALSFQYTCRALKKKGLLSENSLSIPHCVKVYARAISSEQLRSAYCRCGDDDGTILGLDHSFVNEIAGDFSSRDLSLPLWQYEYDALTVDFEIAILDWRQMSSDEIQTKSAVSKTEFIKVGSFDALVYWVDHQLLEDNVMNGTQLLVTTKDKPYNQAIRMLPTPRPLIRSDDVRGNTQLVVQFSWGGLASSSIMSHDVDIQVVRRCEELPSA